MNVTSQRTKSGQRQERRGFARSIAAFTMIEIALSLAVIGFALVAIIGILPAGMAVQRENREQTLVNLDGAFLLDTLRSGAKGQNTLTNYIIAITNIQTLYGTNALTDPKASPIAVKTNWFTTTATSINGTSYPFSVLTNGYNIVGILSTPKYIAPDNTQFYSNTMTADVIGFSGNAVDQGRSQVSKDFAFSYRISVEVTRGTDYPYNPLAVAGVQGADGDWMNLTAPGAGSASVPDFIGGHLNSRLLAHNLQPNSYEFRIKIRWPIMQNGKTGGSSLVFRSSGAGKRDEDAANDVPGLTYYHILPLSFTGAQK